MSFLSPLYALAALAIALPILLHLVRKQPKQHQVFSSLMFLDATTPRLTSARRIDQWLLLLLRSAAILLLALAFSRPYWNVPVASESQRIGVSKMILLDTSASMRRTGIWEAAQQQANRIIDESNPTDLLSIYAFDDSLHPLLSVDESLESSLAQRKDKARVALATAKPTWLQTDLGNALMNAADLLERDRETLSEAPISVSQIVVVTDFQEGTSLEKLADYTWPESIKVRIDQVDVKLSGNVRATVLSSDRLAASQLDAEKKDPDSLIASGMTVRVLVSNQVTSQDNSKITERSLNESFELAWLDANQVPIESTRTTCQVPANSRLTLRIPEPPKEATALRIFGDDDDFDNQYFLTNKAAKKTNILCVDSLSQEPEDSLSYFLKQLPLSSSKQMVSFQQRAPDSTDPWPDPISTPLIVASHWASEQDLQSLKNHVDRGGHVLWVWDAPEENASVKYTEGVRLLSGPEVGQVAESSLRNYAMLQQIDFQHPLFAELSDSKFNDYSKIRFWKHRSIELPSSLEDSNHWEVLCRFDDGSPALLTHTPKPTTEPMALATGVMLPSNSTSKPEASAYGSGRIGGLWIMLAGWQPKESQLALSSKFVPLIAGLYKLASPEFNNSQSMRVGDSIEWSMDTKISGPDGELLTNQSVSESQICNAKLDKPGVYTRYDKNANPSQFSVNITESESLTAPAGLDRLDQYGILVTDRPLNIPSPVVSQQLRALELESQQGWWRWLIVGVLAFVGFESMFCLGKGI